MATDVIAEFSGQGADGRTSTIQVTVSAVADQVVRTTPTATGGFNTATVTADVARTLVFTAADGVPAGRYEKVTTGIFRKHD